LPPRWRVVHGRCQRRRRGPPGPGHFIGLWLRDPLHQPGGPAESRQGHADRSRRRRRAAARADGRHGDRPGRGRHQRRPPAGLPRGRTARAGKGQGQQDPRDPQGQARHREGHRHRRGPAGRHPAGPLARARHEPALQGPRELPRRPRLPRRPAAARLAEGRRPGGRRLTGWTMEPGFWHERWQQGRIGFHQDRPLPRLCKLWPTLDLAVDALVFAPLCGKSLDMAWLAERGHRILGVELSELAVQQFFDERGLAPATRDTRYGRHYRAGPYEINAGDAFKLDAKVLAGCAAIYDRAALIALPPRLRQRYATTAWRHLLPGCTGLLVTL